MNMTASMNLMMHLPVLIELNLIFAKIMFSVKNSGPHLLGTEFYLLYIFRQLFLTSKQT